MEQENHAKVAEIWVEKYRPKFFDDIEGDPSVIGRLRAMIEHGSLQHMMISGPPGTGKTTSVLAMARQLFNDDAKVMNACVKELNASDERGVEVVRNQIKEFARKSVGSLLPPNAHKIIILDEVDSMTSGAQQALRRIMEIYSGSTRFALICNHSTKVIEPLQSRCAIVRFGRLQDHMILHRLLKICDSENVQYDDSGLEMIVFTSEGDMRIAVNNLQSTWQGFGRVTRENVLKVCDVPPPERIKKMLNNALSGDWRDARNVALQLMEEGYNTGDLLSVAKNLVKRGNFVLDNGKPLGDDLMLRSLEILTKATINYSEGNTSFLQVDAALIELTRVGSPLKG
eukprot:GHVH01008777.1.p1 GENE.GHVH01008777.1~~GHVH01008777.1.p1  ORF type:complete len:372 (-),score=42.87 GHVH01008777.1:67-1092(-)